MHGEDNLNDHYKYANEKGSHVHTKSLCTARLREGDKLEICAIDEDLLKKIKDFKMRKAKNTAAIIMKINREKHIVELDEEMEDITIEEFQEALPTHQPSFSLVSYVHKHDDGRVSFPYFFLYVIPQGCKPELQMMFAGTKLSLIKEAQVTKDFEVRNPEEIDEEWLKEKLRFFR